MKSTKNNQRRIGTILDLCGTLYINEELSSAYKACLFRAVASHHYLSIEEAKKLVEETRKDHERSKGFTPPVLLTSDLLNVRSEYMLACNAVEPADFLKKDPRLAKLIERLAAKYKLALLTHSTTLCTLKALKALGIDANIFDAMVCAEDISHPKPDPQPFLEATGRLSLQPTYCIVIGDRPEIDLITPKKLGMWTILVRNQSAKNLECVDCQSDDVFHLEEAISKTARRMCGN